MMGDLHKSGSSQRHYDSHEVQIKLMQRKLKEELAEARVTKKVPAYLLHLYYLKYEDELNGEFSSCDICLKPFK